VPVKNQTKKETKMQQKIFKSVCLPILSLVLSVLMMNFTATLTWAAEPASFKLNGNKFFPIILWHGPQGLDINNMSSADVIELNNAGFNVARIDQPYATPAYVTSISPLNVLINAHPSIGNHTSMPQSRIDDFQAISSGSQLFAFETKDEPYLSFLKGYGYNLSDLIAGKNYFESVIAPNHPVFLNFAAWDLFYNYPGADWNDFLNWTKAGTIYGVDHYSHYATHDRLYESTESFIKLGTMLNTDIDLSNNNAARLATVQACGGGEWTVTPIANSRPSKTDLRFLVYSPIIHGAKGIRFYGAFYTNKTDAIWSDVKSVATELSTLGDVLAKGTTVSNYTLSDTAILEAVCKSYGGEYYLIVCNKTDSTHYDKTITLINWPSDEVEVMFESPNSATAVNGVLTPDFDPWETHIYKSKEPAPTITVTSPSGGQSWAQGSTQTLTWTTTGPISNVKIMYSTTGDGGPFTTITNSTPNDGSYSWVVPAEPSSNAWIRISDTVTGIYDKNNSAFSITAPTVTITTPNGWENYIIGTTSALTWTTTGSISNVKIMYSTTGDGGPFTTITNSTPNDGSFYWTVPNEPSSDTWIRISDTATGIYDKNNSKFSIVQPTITVNSPNGGESVIVGTSYNLRWSSNGGNVKIMYSTTGDGGPFTTITNSTPNDGSFYWTVPNEKTSNAWIRISDVYTGKYDKNNSAFTIE
jgi:hypothetical protein